MASSASEALKALVACAKAIQDRNLKLADSLLERIWNLAAVQSDPTKSDVVKYFAEALVRRAYGLSSPSAYFTLLTPPRPCDIFPFSKCDAIKTVWMGKKRLHLITSLFLSFNDWIRLFRSLANASGDSLSVRISVIVSPFLEKIVKIQQERIMSDATFQASISGIQLEDLRVVYANSLGDVDASKSDFTRRKDEAVIVYYQSKLHQMLADARVMERELLKLRQINPEMVIILEYYADHNDSNFIKRLEDSFQYYLDVNPFSMKLSYYRREIGNIVECEGRDRLERHQTWAQWRSLLLANGLLPVPLEPPAGSILCEHNGCLVYRQNGCPRDFVSAWKLTGAVDRFDPISYNPIQGFNPNPALEDTVQPLQVDPLGSSLNRLAAFAEIYDMLEDVCLRYELPLALTWVTRTPNGIMSGPNKKRSLSIETTYSYNNYYYNHYYYYNNNDYRYFKEIVKYESFMDECAEHNLLEGQAIAGQALQSNEPFLFEPNINELKNYPFAEAAQNLDELASLAICLVNHYACDDVYILEFFLPPSEEKLEEPKSLALRIFEDLKNMKKKFVKLRVDGTEVGLQGKAIPNIPQATMPMRSSPPASSKDQFLNSNASWSLNIAKLKEVHVVEIQGLNGQEAVTSNFHPAYLPIHASSMTGTEPFNATNLRSCNGLLETHEPQQQEITEKNWISQTISNIDHKIVKANRENSAVPRTKQRKLVSEVWKEFTKFEENGKQLAKCNHCNKEFTGSSKSGTTHLKNHLERCPRKKNEYQERQLKLSAKTGDLTTRDTNKGNSMFDQEKSRLNLVKMIIKHQYPLDVAEQEFFKTFVKNLQPMFEFQSQATIISDIHHIYEEEKKKLQQCFAQFACNFNLTISLWKDNLRKNAYCCLIAHFVDDDWELRKKILVFKNLEHNYDTGSIIGVIQNSISEWNMSEKVCSITVDNSSLNNGIVQQIKESCISDQVSLPSCHYYTSCTLVQDGLHEIDDILLKLRKSIEYVTELEHGKLKFQEAIHQVKLQGGKSRDYGPLRLDSDFSILDSALESRQIFCQLEQIDGHFKVNPSIEEWEKALILHSYLKGFYDSLSSFRQTHSSTANTYFPQLCDMYKKFLQMEKKNYPFMMKRKFDNHWSLCNSVFAIAAVLDPRLKFKFVEFSYGEIYGRDCKMQLNRFHKVLTDIYFEYADEPRNRTTSASVGCLTRQSTESANDSILDSFSRYASESNFNEVSSWKSDLDCYLDEPLLHLDGAFFDILGWWRVNSERFPTLGRMARDLLAMPVSVVPPCSDFSIVITNPTYNGLNPETMEALVCSHNWLEMPKGNDRANHAPVQNTAKRKWEEKETHKVTSCKNWNSKETNNGDKAKASYKMPMRALPIENDQQEGSQLKSSEPNHGKDNSGLIEIPNGYPSFDNQSEFQCSSSDESDGEIAGREQEEWHEEDVRAYLVSPSTEKELKRLSKGQNHKMSGKLVGRNKEFGVVDYKLAPLLTVPHGVETRVEFYIDDSVVNTFFKLLKKRSDRFPRTYVNHYSFDSWIATYLIEGSRSEHQVLSWFKDEKLKGVTKLFLPVCLSAHWVLFCVDTKKQTFSWLDSNISSRMYNVVEQQAILGWFKRFLLPAFGYHNAYEWPFEIRTDIPEQKNGVDCGLFVMKYADCLTHGDFFPFTQQDMPHFRLRTFLDIYRGRLHSQK